MGSVSHHAPSGATASANGHATEVGFRMIETPLEALAAVSAKDLLPLILRTVGSDAPQDDDADLYRALHTKLADLTGLVMQFREPGAAEAYVLRSLPRKFEFACELLYGKRKPAIGGGDAEHLALLEIVSGGGDHS